MAKQYAMDDRAQLHDAANELLSQNLVAGEGVRVIIPGASNSALIGTDRRVFVFKKGWLSGATFGKKMSSWDYQNLVGVHLETGLLTGVVALQAPGVDAVDTNFWTTGKQDPWKAPNAIAIQRDSFQRAREGVALLRQLIADNQQRRSGATSATTAPAVDPAERLRKLAELRDAGILTPEEFAAKKAEILAQM